AFSREGQRAATVQSALSLRSARAADSQPIRPQEGKAGRAGGRGSRSGNCEQSSTIEYTSPVRGVVADLHDLLFEHPRHKLGRRRIMLQISRRSAILAMPGILMRPRLASASGRSTFRGVALGTQTYSFRDRPLDDAIAAMAQIGFGACEVSGRHVEPQD